MNKKYIYTVTGLECGLRYQNTKPSKDGIYNSYRKRTSPTQKVSFRISSSRCWGWYLDLEIAKQTAEHDWEALHGDFNYLVIEKVPEGCLTNTPDKEWWYKWKGTLEIGHYEYIKKPKQFDHIVGFWC